MFGVVDVEDGAWWRRGGNGRHGRYNSKKCASMMWLDLRRVQVGSCQGESACARYRKSPDPRGTTIQYWEKKYAVSHQQPTQRTNHHQPTSTSDQMPSKLEITSIISEPTLHFTISINNKHEALHCSRSRSHRPHRNRNGLHQKISPLHHQKEYHPCNGFTC